MKEIGISVYPDFYNIEIIKEQLDYAKSLGYKDVFTSLQLGDLGFENAGIGITKEFSFIFDYCHQIGLEIHVDINDRMLKYLQASPSNLKPIADLKIKVLRLDGGFTNEEAASMTTNEYGIIIEENASMLQFPKARIETIVKKGNVKQYYACHNYFPLNETGLLYQDALHAAKLFKSYGIKVGIFICSLYAENHLNAIGSGVPTIEEHRYKPAHIQAMELFVHDAFDYVIFGDTNPSKEELLRVSEVAKNDSIMEIEKKYSIEYLEKTEIDGLFCVEIPVWFNKDISPILKEKLTSIVFLSRADQPELMIRATQSRGIDNPEVYLPIVRNKYSLVIDNCLANRYVGELQIPLCDLPAARYANVIGMVKPYGYRLLELLRYANVPFILKEE